MDTKDRDNDLLEPKRTREEELRYRRRKAAYLKKKKKRRRIRKIKRYTVLGGMLLIAFLLIYLLVKLVLMLPIFNRGADPKDVQVPAWITQELIQVNPNSRPQDPLEKVKGVVIHHALDEGTSAEQIRSYYDSLAETKKAYASAHFIIGLDGEIIQCIPLNEIAYASNKRNVDTIAIEFCYDDSTGKPTAAGYDSMVKLTKWLSDTFHLKQKNIMTHLEATGSGKICPKYYVENEAAWKQFLTDVKNAVLPAEPKTSSEQ